MYGHLHTFMHVLGEIYALMSVRGKYSCHQCLNMRIYM